MLTGRAGGRRGRDIKSDGEKKEQEMDRQKQNKKEKKSQIRIILKDE